MWEKEEGIKVQKHRTLHSLLPITATQCQVLGSLHPMNQCLLVFHILWQQQDHKKIFFSMFHFPTSRRERQSIGSCYIICMYPITNLSPLHQAELHVYRTVQLLGKQGETYCRGRNDGKTCSCLSNQLDDVYLDSS